MKKVIREDLEKIYKNTHIDWELLRGRTVFITGAYGMIPSYMVLMCMYLNDMGYGIKTYAVGRNIDKAKELFGEYWGKDEFNFLQVNVCDILKENIAIDYIIHGASPTNPQAFATNPIDVILPNTIGTYNTLELGRKCQVKGYLYLSSGAVYGNVEKLEIGENDMGNMDCMDVKNCYGESKRLAENLCVAFQYKHGIPCKVARISHTYGPTMNLELDTRGFVEFVASAVRGEDILIKSDGKTERAFSYISDTVEALFLILLHGKAGEAYNVCNNSQRISILELAKIICEIVAEKQIKIQFTSKGSGYWSTPIDCPPYHNIDKVLALGATFNITCEEGFKRTIQSFCGIE